MRVGLPLTALRWKSVEAQREHPPEAQTHGSLVSLQSRRCSIQKPSQRLVRRWYASSRAPAPLGTSTLWGSVSWFSKGVGGPRSKAVRSRPSVPGMSYGVRPTCAIGMARPRPVRWPTSPYRKPRTAHPSSGWSMYPTITMGTGRHNAPSGDSDRCDGAERLQLSCRVQRFGCRTCG